MIRFAKYHGLGNDFIIIEKDTLDAKGIGVNEYENFASNICNRHTGIGADGLIIVAQNPGDEVPVEMIIYNSDGSLASMCGNGIRCFAEYCYDEGIIDKDQYKIKTGSGILTVNIVSRTPFITKVNMGKPNYDSRKSAIDTELPEFINQEINLPYLMGLDEKKNPDWNFKVSTFFMDTIHTVIWEDENEVGAVGFIGVNGANSVEEVISELPLFKEKTNVNMVSIIDKDTIKVNTYERGAGPTLACGTGACASVALGIREGKLNKRVRVILSLGELIVTQSEDGDIYMEGISEKVFDGNIKI